MNTQKDAQYFIFLQPVIYNNYMLPLEKHCLG